jgi:hypothetical protein
VGVGEVNIGEVAIFLFGNLDIKSGLYILLIRCYFWVTSNFYVCGCGSIKDANRGS